MKVVELVKFSREMLKTLSENEVKTGDWKYVKMYEEYKAQTAIAEEDEIDDIITSHTNAVRAQK